MKLIHCTILILLSINISSQDLQCDISIELKNAYDYDVSQLALERIIELNSKY